MVGPRNGLILFLIGVGGLTALSCPGVDGDRTPRGVGALALTPVASSAPPAPAASSVAPVAPVVPVDPPLQPVPSPVVSAEAAVDELEDAVPGSWPDPTPEEIDALSRQVAAEQASAPVGPAPAPMTEGEELGSLERESSELNSDNTLVALARVTPVYAKPNPAARRLGYLRAGAKVRRGMKRAGTRGCSGGWYAIVPEGYVCVGDSAVLDARHPLAEITRRRADRIAALPYVYGMSKNPPPPLYATVPSAATQARIEAGRSTGGSPSDDGEWTSSWDSVPEFLRQGGRGVFWRGAGVSGSDSILGRALPKSGFSLLSFFEEGGRKWGLTADLELVPLDRLRRIPGSRFHGVPLDAEHPLPVVFVRGGGALLLAGQGDGIGPAVRPLEPREAVFITGKTANRGGVEYLETRSGHWVKNANLVRVDGMRNRPGWAEPGRTWIDVSILQQSLVAYEGDKPVYATLVSSGVDGLGDPKETHSTVLGQFLIHTKHVTTTMSGDEAGDEFDLRDVPYVQYFTEGYALHAAYWHDGFGQPRSHGCINLSPIDARWLFEWTDPPVPEGWHGALSLTQGTLVNVHP